MKKHFLIFLSLLLLTGGAFLVRYQYSSTPSVAATISPAPEFYQTERTVHSALLIFEKQNPSPLQTGQALESLLRNLQGTQNYQQITIIKTGDSFPIDQSTVNSITEKYFPQTPVRLISFSSTDSEATVYAELSPYFADNSLTILPTSLQFNQSDATLENLQTDYFQTAFDNLTKASISNLPFSNPEAIRAFYQLNKDHLSLKTLQTLPDPNHLFLLKYFTAGDRYFTPSVSLTFFGDIMLGRLVRTIMNKQGLDYPFQKIDPSYLQFNDLLIANLEGPIATTAVRTSKSIAFRFLPDIAPLLKKYSFDLLGRANNHAYDMGQAGFDDTAKYLNEQGIAVFGDARDVDDLTTYKTEINGEKIAFLGLNDTDYKLDQAKKDHLYQLLSQLQTDGYQPIVFIHWGVEYQHQPQATQVTFAHDLIDHGVIALIGMHPHVVESFEVYNNHPIFYSLGNFIFDQYFSSDTQEGLTVNLVLEPGKIKVSLFPVKIDQSQPELMTGDEKKAFLERLVGYWHYSDNIKDQILQGQIELNTAYSN